eukprot:2598220-Prymnesium_polylepis.1
MRRCGAGPCGHIAKLRCGVSVWVGDQAFFSHNVPEGKAAAELLPQDRGCRQDCGVTHQQNRDRLSHANGNGDDWAWGAGWLGVN